MWVSFKRNCLSNSKHKFISFIQPSKIKMRLVYQIHIPRVYSFLECQAHVWTNSQGLYLGDLIKLSLEEPFFFSLSLFGSQLKLFPPRHSQTRTMQNFSHHILFSSSLVNSLMSQKSQNRGGDPQIDKSPRKSEEDLIDKISEQLPNIPIHYLNENRETNWKGRKDKSVRNYRGPTPFFKIKLSKI